MLNINLKARLENKTWWVSTIALFIVLLQQIGLGQLADYIPKNYADIINSIFLLAGAFGIVVDTSTSGISDQTSVSNSTGNQIQTDSNNTNASSENSSNSTSTSNLDNSASSKIVVDNPDNAQIIGQEVNAKSSTNPQ